MMMKSMVPATLLLLVHGCAPEAPAEDGFTAAGMVAAEVVAGNLMPWVSRLAEGHLRDEKLSCAGYQAFDLYPACELSRDSAVREVREAFIGMGLSTRIESTGTGAQAAQHVVAEMRGIDRPEEVVLLGAHLDAFYAGADDNSSGVAVMLEVARVLAGRRLGRSVRFVGFDLEERGDEGSAQYVGGGRADDVVAAIVLETVGFASEQPGSQKSLTGFSWGTVGDFLAIAANGDSTHLAEQLLAMNHRLGLIKMKGFVAGGTGAHPLTGALLRSDNGPFWLRGKPALMWTDTANFRNPHYHKATDTPETLNAAFLAAVARAAAAAVALFAEVEP
jgi:hypothetical protein